MNKSSNSNTWRRDRLLKVLDGAEESSDALAGAAQDLLADATQSLQIARALRPIIESAPDDSALPTGRWDLLTSTFRAADTVARTAHDTLAAVRSVSVTSSSSALTTTVSTLHFDSWIPAPERGLVINLEKALHRPMLIDEVSALLRAFALDVPARGSRSPLDLLMEAHEALIKPSGSKVASAGVLLPARESLDVAVAALLRRRPVQERTGPPAAKIKSIGDQVGDPEIAASQFEALGIEYSELRDRLSEAKQAALRHADVTRLMDAVLYFFKSFLSSIEVDRLRPT